MKKKEKGFLARCPLAVLIILTTVLLTLAAALGMITGFYNFKWSWSHPMLEAVLLGDRATDEAMESGSSQEIESLVIPSSSQEQTAVGNTDAPAETIYETQPIETQPVGTDEGNQPVVSTEITEAPTEAPRTDRIPRPMQFAPRNPVEVKSGYYDDPQRTPMNKDYPYVVGDDAYFADALFIGDSRTQGLYYYGDIPTATYAFLEGVSLFSLMNSELELSTGGKATVEAILANGQYKKVYIMLGLNELGDHTAPEYGQFFANVINSIKSMEPNAVVTLMGSMVISTEQSLKSDWRNNDNINSRNYWASVYACDNTDVFYLNNDIPELIDETGGLGAAFTNDGIHLKAEFYKLWCQNIRTHALQSNMWLD